MKQAPDKEALPTLRSSPTNHKQLLCHIVLINQIIVKTIQQHALRMYLLGNRHRAVTHIGSDSFVIVKNSS